MPCLLLLIFGLCGLVILVQGQCSSPLYNDLNDSLSSVVQRFNTTGLVMLLPDIKFNCTGYITSIEGWMYLDVISSTHYLQYEIWRPTSSNKYNLVSSVIINDGTDYRGVTDNIRAYTHNASSGNGQLQFQKDDIFGIYLPDPISGNIFFPTYLTDASQENGGPGIRVYSATSEFGPCSVALCSNHFSIMENVTFQIRIKQRALSTPLNQQPPGCLDTPEFLMCEMSSVSPTINSQSSSHSLSSSSLSTTLLITPTTQPSDPFLVGGIIVVVVCICNFVCACLIIACIIVCVKKRFKSNPEVLSTSLSAPNIDDHDTNVNTLQDNPVYATIAESSILQDNPAYATSTGSTTLQDNPSYATSAGSTTLQDNPAYARASNTVPVSTIMNPNEVIDDDYI